MRHEKLFQRFFIVPVLLVLVGATFFFTTVKTYAAPGIPNQINFQGKLVNSNGTNVVDNTYSVVFTLYTAPSGGTTLWTETQNVTTTTGAFQVSLGSVTSLADVNFNQDQLYLGIKVGSDSEMTPRIRFTAVPYAFNADKLNGVTATQSGTGFTLTGGSSTLKTLTINDSLILGTTIQPSSTNALTILSNGANGLTLDAGGSATLSIGTTNANGVSISKTGSVTTINGGLTLASGQNLIINGDTFTDLTGNGLTVSTNLLGLNLTSSGGTGATSSNSGLEVSASGLTLLKGCADGQLLEYTDAGGWACANDDSTAGGGGGSNWTLLNGVLRPNNNTADVLFGGTSTDSAKFAFGGLNSGTAIATFSADLLFEAQANSSPSDQTAWTKVSNTAAGTIASGGTAAIASISAMAVYNGNVYVGTYRDGVGSAEVYRYEGYNSTWTRVSQTTPGTLASGGTATIGSVSAMTVFDGRLYAGTSKMNAAEIYRYDGGTTWTRVSNPTAGTIGTATAQDGVSSLAVYQGRLYAGTREPNAARLIRWDGGLNWNVINGTAGTFVATNTIAVSAVSSMVSMNGGLYLGLSKPGDADVVKYTGAATFLALNLASATGSYTINGAAVTGFDEVTAMTIYNGNLVLGMQKPNGAEVLVASPQVGETGINTFSRLNNVAGQMNNGGTTNIDQIASLAVYNGMLYVGTREANAGEIYRYTGGDQKFLRVSAGAGQVASGGTTGIDGVVKLIQSNGDIFAGTMELGAAEVYRLSNVNINKSYALKFHANPSIVGESGVAKNTASIFYLASASANLGSNDGRNGAFIFSHGIQTRNGSYDVAEDYPTRDDSLEVGELVAIDPNERGFVKKSDGAYDHAVIGVYSESPALRLSQQDSAIDGGRVIPVALAGRVPVKVSTENGRIQPGDYLTASSLPGVAMKATKSGVVVGQAMEVYADEGVGKVLAYVKSSSYQGSLAAEFTNIDTTASNANEQLLATLKTQENAFVESEIVTDKLIAGLEIVTPNIVADTITAKKIRADQIEGLEFLVRGQTNSAVPINSTLTASVAGAQTTNTFTDELTVKSLSIDGLATVSSTLRVKNNTLVEGVLNVIDTLTTKSLIVSKIADFFGLVIFHDDVSFQGRPTFNNDTAGLAIIKAGSDHVEVKFTKEYDEAPVVSANVVLDQVTKSPSQSDADQENRQKELEQKMLNNGISYLITRRTNRGFMIRLGKPMDHDITFSWTALSVEKPEVFENASYTPFPTPTMKHDELESSPAVSPTLRQEEGHQQSSGVGVPFQSQDMEGGDE